MINNQTGLDNIYFLYTQNEKFLRSKSHYLKISLMFIPLIFNIVFLMFAFWVASFFSTIIVDNVQKVFIVICIITMPLFYVYRLVSTMIKVKNAIKSMTIYDGILINSFTDRDLANDIIRHTDHFVYEYIDKYGIKVNSSCRRYRYIFVKYISPKSGSFLKICAFDEPIPVWMADFKEFSDFVM